MVSCPRPVFRWVLGWPETGMAASGRLVRSGLAWPSCFDCLDGGNSRSELLDVSALKYEQTRPQELAFFDVHAVGEAFLLQHANFVVIGLGHRKAVTHDLLFFRSFDFFFGGDGLHRRRFSLRFIRRLRCLALGFLCCLDRWFGAWLAFAHCRLGSNRF